MLVCTITVASVDVGRRGAIAEADSVALGEEVASTVVVDDEVSVKVVIEVETEEVETKLRAVVVTKRDVTV